MMTETKLPTEQVFRLKLGQTAGRLRTASNDVNSIVTLLHALANDKNRQVEANPDVLNWLGNQLFFVIQDMERDEREIQEMLKDPSIPQGPAAGHTERLERLVEAQAEDIRRLSKGATLVMDHAAVSQTNSEEIYEISVNKKELDAVWT
jgi:hypothetical protein